MAVHMMHVVSVGTLRSYLHSFPWHLQVLHDGDLARVAGTAHSRPISQLTAAEASTIDVGSWMHERFKTERIPLLSDVLTMYAGALVHLHVVQFAHPPTPPTLPGPPPAPHTRSPTRRPLCDSQYCWYTDRDLLAASERTRVDSSEAALPLANGSTVIYSNSYGLEFFKTTQDNKRIQLTSLRGAGAEVTAGGASGSSGGSCQARGCVAPFSDAACPCGHDQCFPCAGADHHILSPPPTAALLKGPQCMCSDRTSSFIKDYHVSFEIIV